LAAITSRQHDRPLLVRARRNALAVGTAIGALFGLGYGRGAYAACTPATGAVVCSGTEIVTQNITGPATITTDPGFSVNTAVGDAISISGSGPVSFVDANGSYIVGYDDAIQAIITGTGDLTITTDADSILIGGQRGILASVTGTGALTVTSYGEVTGTNDDGIVARITNTGSSAGLTVTTGTNSTVSGRYWHPGPTEWHGRAVRHRQWRGDGDGLRRHLCPDLQLVSYRRPDRHHRCGQRRERR
jgi:hypothetical protein